MSSPVARPRIGMLHCRRCHAEAEAMDEPPVGGDLGDLVRSRICAPCWAAWMEQAVMAINEERLKLFRVADRSRLEALMRQFLRLDEA